MIMNILIDFLLHHHSCQFCWIGTPEAFVSTETRKDYFLYGSARSEEAGISLNYLQCIHEKHDKWFIEGAFENPGNSGAISFVWSSIQMCFDVLCKPFTSSEVILP
jgi:hypothetical protein